MHYSITINYMQTFVISFHLQKILVYMRSELKMNIYITSQCKTPQSLFVGNFKIFRRFILIL